MFSMMKGRRPRPEDHVAWSKVTRALDHPHEARKRGTLIAEANGHFQDRSHERFRS